MSDIVKQPLLELLAFGASGVKRADCHAVVVRMRETGYPVAIVSVAGELVEVLTPDNPEFVKSLRMLESVAQVELKRPTQVRVGD
jgi:hypothetical protein